MSKITDQKYLKADQYRDSSNLDARIAIHQSFSTNSYGWFNWVFDTLIKLPANATILELGCGSAAMWKECANRIPGGWDMTLSDLSSGMIDAARRNLAVIGLNYKFKEIDAQGIPFEDETFDAVIANHMLYHVPDRPKAIAEIKRVLKPNGRLIATTIGKNHMNEMANWLRQVNPGNTFDSFGSPFTLENGFEQLKQFFPRMTISRYPDNSHVTEVEPIIFYIRSSMHAKGLVEEELSKIQVVLKKELKEKGGIFISKDSGLFEAVK